MHRKKALKVVVTNLSITASALNATLAQQLRSGNKREERVKPRAHIVSPKKETSPRVHRRQKHLQHQIMIQGSTKLEWRPLKPGETQGETMD